MSVRVETTYLATCDYPDCHMTYDFWELTEEDAILEVIDNGEWLCLFAGDNKPRFFCPAHLRYVQNSRNVWSNVFYDSNSPYTQTTSHGRGALSPSDHFVGCGERHGQAERVCAQQGLG